MRGVVLASLLLAIAFFVLPTRVHERYLFPALALGALLVFSGRAWPWLYAALSVSFFANIYWVYTEDWSFAGPRIINPGVNGAPMPQSELLTSTLLTDGGIWLLALLITVALAVVAWLALRLSLEPREQPIQLAPESVAAPPVARAGREPRRAAAGAVWLAPNPADAYLHEPSRRLDRRDAVALLALVVFALVFRLWRLDTPRSQHFDEVYHARSAAEFLANWNNDWTRDVYEWTHPMLAKYLIAGGIVAADPNRVVGSTELESASSALTVAPRRASVGHDRSIALLAAGGATIIAMDADTGEEVASWSAGGPIASLAYDAEAYRLLVGRADSGTVETYELAGLLASPDGRAPPAGPSIESGLETVNQVARAVRGERSDPAARDGRRGRRRAGNRRGPRERRRHVRRHRPRRGGRGGGAGLGGRLRPSAQHRRVPRREHAGAAPGVRGRTGSRRLSSARSSCAIEATHRRCWPSPVRWLRQPSIPPRSAASPSWTPTAATVAAAAIPARSASSRCPVRRCSSPSNGSPG